MKLHRRIAILLIVLFAVSCGKASSGESAKMWKLGSRYSDLTYGTIAHVYEYEKAGDHFCLSVTRNKQDAGSSKNVKDSAVIGDRVYALCESSRKTSDETRDDTLYECLTGKFRYALFNSETALDMGSVLSLNEAAALMQSPTELPEGVAFLGESWNAYFRTKASNLEIYVYVNDNGRHATAPSDKYESREDNGVSYLYSEYDRAILYTDGVNSVWIRQADRAEMKHKAYDTLSECKAILAMLGSN